MVEIHAPLLLLSADGYLKRYPLFLYYYSAEVVCFMLYYLSGEALIRFYLYLEISIKITHFYLLVSLCFP